MEEVVNDHVLSAIIAFPARSLTPVVIVAVYEVVRANDDIGSNVTVFSSAPSVTVPVILVE